MGNEQSVIKAIASAKKRQDSNLVFNRDILDLQWIPEEASSLKLDCLKLIDMNLLVAPSQMFFIHSLRKLDLSKNKLHSIRGIGSLINLTDLDLSINILEYVPDEICALGNLLFLNISNNHLENRSLPPKLLSLSFSSLDISENSFSMTPELLDCLSKSDSISIHSNLWAETALAAITSDTNEDEVKLVIKNLHLPPVVLKSEKSIIVEEVPKRPLVDRRTTSIGEPSKANAVRLVKEVDRPKSEVLEILESESIISHAPPPPEISPPPVPISRHVSSNQVPSAAPERTASPLKQANRPSGPKGRRLPTIDGTEGGLSLSEESLARPALQSPSPVSHIAESLSSTLIFSHDIAPPRRKKDLSFISATSTYEDQSNSFSDSPPPTLPSKTTKPQRDSSTAVPNLVGEDPAIVGVKEVATISSHSTMKKASTGMLPLINCPEIESKPLEASKERQDVLESTPPILAKRPDISRAATAKEQSKPTEPADQSISPKSKIPVGGVAVFDMSEMRMKQGKGSETHSKKTSEIELKLVNEQSQILDPLDLQPAKPKVPIGGVAIFDVSEMKANLAKSKKPSDSKIIAAPVADSSKIKLAQVVSPKEVPPQIAAKPKIVSAESGNDVTSAPKKPIGGVAMFDLAEMRSRQEKVAELHLRDDSSKGSVLRKDNSIEEAPVKTHSKEPSLGAMFGGVKLPISSEQLEARRVKVSSQIDEPPAPASLQISQAPQKPAKPVVTSKSSVEIVGDKPVLHQAQSFNNSTPRSIIENKEKGEGIPAWKVELEKRQQQQHI